MNLQKFWVILPLAALLSGCATSQEELLPVGEETMSDIWAEKSGGT